jgi:hypothetical protein
MSKLSQLRGSVARSTGAAADAAPDRFSRVDNLLHRGGGEGAEVNKPAAPAPELPSAKDVQLPARVLPDEGSKKLTLLLPKGLWKEFRNACTQKDRSGQVILEQLVRDFVADPDRLVLEQKPE